MARTRKIFFGFAFCLGALLFVRPARLSALDLPPLNGLDSHMPAPEFPADLLWLNTATPYSIHGLHGKIILLDFWTYCCINCMHVLPDLHKLELKYSDDLVVLGVHSAKFSAEQASSKIRQAILRYKIHHPVLNDHNLTVWNLYGVQAWPTLVLIDPDGKIVGAVSGEGNYEALDKAIAGLAKKFGPEIHKGALHNRLEAASALKRPLSFPGKVLADVKGGRLFVSDSDHNRIVIAALDSGRWIATIGSGEAALTDGDFSHSAFHNPQGLALSDDEKMLYVADTDNHAIRKVDLSGHRVITLAGDGSQAGFQARGGLGSKAKLNSPWDLVLLRNTLYVAMAGAHQIWSMDLGARNISPLIGDGNEDLQDGSLTKASLAQTSGITTDGSQLFFADSESSSIRRASLGLNGEVVTLVGQGLFDFGDAEGSASKARLQHPLGVHYSAGKLYVADTYNNRIKILDPVSGEIHFFAGDGKEGWKDGDGADAHFDEPGGLWIGADKLYVADTNNDVIRVVDLRTKQVSTFEITGLTEN